MRANEIVQMYDSTFTKKRSSTTGLNYPKCTREWRTQPEEVLANLSRLKWVIDSAETTLRSQVEIYRDKRTVLVLEFNSRKRWEHHPITQTMKFTTS
jgi:hypothetical protein